MKLKTGTCRSAALLGGPGKIPFSCFWPLIVSIFPWLMAISLQALPSSSTTLCCSIIKTPSAFLLKENLPWHLRLSLITQNNLSTFKILNLITSSMPFAQRFIIRLGQLLSHLAQRMSFLIPTFMTTLHYLPSRFLLFLNSPFYLPFLMDSLSQV